MLLKRGLAATIEELLQAAEYILVGRQRARGAVRARHPHLRDGHAVHARHQRRAGAQADDVSAGGRRSEPRRRADRTTCRPWPGPAVAAGADGLLVEVHPNPAEALSDGAQSLDPAAFAEMMAAVGRVAEAIGRRVA